ncbi:hypothetical protein [Actinospongicola halichondriae]|uniref:hypothetical protein n=1 Tax=Actinospongicola halichondriae TaxID=3236844 RepID=UPI003D43D50A
MTQNDSTLSRRAILRGLAVGGAATLAVPTVLSRPVGAQTLGSECLPGVLDWDDYDAGTAFTNAVIEGTTVSISSQILGSTSVLSDNLTIQNGPHGGVNQRFLKLNQLPSQSSFNNGQVITIAFSPQVTNVQFTLTDIDNVFNGWGDRVLINQAGFVATTPVGSTVIGTGQVLANLVRDPFRNSVLNSNYNDSSPGGNVTLTFAGPINSLSFRYYNQSNTGGGNQRIGISDITFDPCPPAAGLASALSPALQRSTLPSEGEAPASEGVGTGEEPVQSTPIPGYEPSD